MAAGAAASFALPMLCSACVWFCLCGPAEFKVLRQPACQRGVTVEALHRCGAGPKIHVM
jgi:hypothetical protein